MVRMGLTLGCRRGVLEGEHSSRDFFGDFFVTSPMRLDFPASPPPVDPVLHLRAVLSNNLECNVTRSRESHETRNSC